MTEETATVPKHRCGLELQHDDLELPPDMAWEPTRPFCCWRPVWEGYEETDRCIWHADVDEKPVAELITTRADAPERLDGAILRALHGEGEPFSLRGCSLLGARIETALQNIDGIDFTNADLGGPDPSSVEYVGVYFTGAGLPAADGYTPLAM